MPVRRGPIQGEGEPLNVRICHCRNCQKAMGSPFFARALFRNRLTVKATPRAMPLGCWTGCSARPAARLFAWRKSPAVAACTRRFDDRNAFAPTEHIWVAEKMDCG